MNVIKLSNIITRVRHQFSVAYSIDARSLAVFRIAVGLVVLFDLLRRLSHSTILYSDAGVLPRKDAIAALSSSRWSLLFVNGSPEFVYAFMCVGILAALAMILGWKTRVATILLWVIVLSVQVRNVGVNDGSDNLVRVTLFWAMLLPLGQIWSLDSRSSDSSSDSSSVPRPVAIASIAGFGLILQQASMYLFTAMHKDGPRWLEEGTALYYALGMNQVNRSIGEWLFQHGPHWLLATLTFGTIIVEFMVPIMLLLPVRSALLRTTAVFLIWSLHLGIFTTMQVEIFPFIAIAGSFALLPSNFWIVVVPRLSALVPGRLVQWLPNWRPTSNMAPSGVSTFASHQDPAGNAKLHFKVQIPAVAFSGSTIIASICAVAIVLSAMSNVARVSSFNMPSALDSIIWSVGLQQSWRMFAPQPASNTYWYIVEGVMESGDSVDLYTPIAEDDMTIAGPVMWDQSDNVQYPSKFWRKYFTYSRNSDTRKSRYTTYACNTWNAEHSGDERLVTVNFFRSTSTTLPNSERAKPVHTDLGSWDCT